MWLLVVIAIIALGYLLFIRPHKYWKNRGVPQGNPAFIFGDSWRAIFRLQSQCEMVQTLYKINPGGRYAGIYQFALPALVIRDPDLIKQVTVKEFDHFVDHQSFFPEGEPLFAKNLISLTGQKWRDMRSTLSPAFTSSKMKYMFSLISQSGEQFIKHFLKQDQNLITVEMKDIFTRFTNDVIANTAFGVEVDSLGQPENEFYAMGKEATDLTGLWKNFVFLTNFLFPWISRLFKLSFIRKEVGTFFKEVVTGNIASREKHGIVRPDMIHLLMEARKHGIKYEENHDVEDTGFATAQESEIGKSQKVVKSELSDIDITAQALIFFFAGFDSVSSLMCFLSYELGVNPDIQQKLIQEVDETFENCKGKLTYEALTKMKYMDMVTSESLRKWPNAPATDRKCTKPFTIQPIHPNEKPVYVKEGDLIIIPFFGLHRDPKYFPDPERFDPERFSDENKGNIKPYTYLPFGAGPRNCIGSRFALLETKILFFYILSHFEIVPVEKTKIPLKLSTKSFNTTAEGGFWFGLKRRVK